MVRLDGNILRMPVQHGQVQHDSMMQVVLGATIGCLEPAPKQLVYW